MESNYAKELARWDAPRRAGGMRPDSFEAFPAMVYKARRAGVGPYVVVDPRDEQWTMANCLTVQSPEMLDRALKQGWRQSPQEAIEYAVAEDKRIADEAAARAYSDRNLSEKARAEAEAYEAQSFEHVPEIPSAPLRKKPGPKPKSDAAA